MSSTPDAQRPVIRHTTTRRRSHARMPRSPGAGTARCDIDSRNACLSLSPSLSLSVSLLLVGRGAAGRASGVRCSSSSSSSSLSSYSRGIYHTSCVVRWRKLLRCYDLCSSGRRTTSLPRRGTPALAGVSTAQSTPRNRLRCRLRCQLRWSPADAGEAQREACAVAVHSIAFAARGDAGAWRRRVAVVDDTDSVRRVLWVGHDTMHDVPGAGKDGHV